MSELGTVNDNNRHSHINVHTEQDTQSPLLNKNEIPHKYKDVLEGLGKRPTSEGQTSATHATTHHCHTTPRSQRETSGTGEKMYYYQRNCP